MSNAISITLTGDQAAKIQPLIAEVVDETTNENGMILGTATSVKGEIVVTFEAVSRELGLKLIEIAGGKTNAESSF